MFDDSAVAPWSPVIGHNGGRQSPTDAIIAAVKTLTSCLQIDQGTSHSQCVGQRMYFYLCCYLCVASEGLLLPNTKSTPVKRANSRRRGKAHPSKHAASLRASVSKATPPSAVPVSSRTGSPSPSSASSSSSSSSTHSRHTAHGSTSENSVVEVTHKLRRSSIASLVMQLTDDEVQELAHVIDALLSPEPRQRHGRNRMSITRGGKGAAATAAPKGHRGTSPQRSRVSRVVEQTAMTSERSRDSQRLVQTRAQSPTAVLSRPAEVDTTASTAIAPLPRVSVAMDAAPASMASSREVSSSDRRAPAAAAAGIVLTPVTASVTIAPTTGLDVSDEHIPSVPPLGTRRIEQGTGNLIIDVKIIRSTFAWHVCVCCASARACITCMFLGVLSADTDRCPSDVATCHPA